MLAVGCSHKNVSLGFGDCFQRPVSCHGSVLSRGEGQSCLTHPRGRFGQPGPQKLPLLPSPQPPRAICASAGLRAWWTEGALCALTLRSTGALELPQLLLEWLLKLKSFLYWSFTWTFSCFYFSPPCTLSSRWHSHGCLMQLKEKRALQLCVHKLSHLSKLFHKMFTFLLRLPLPWYLNLSFGFNLFLVGGKKLLIVLARTEAIGVVVQPKSIQKWQ